MRARNCSHQPRKSGTSWAKKSATARRCASGMSGSRMTGTILRKWSCSMSRVGIAGPWRTRSAVAVASRCTRDQYPAGPPTVGPSVADEIKIFPPRQRAVGERLLPAFGRIEDVVAHQPEELVDLDSWREHPLLEGGDERAVRPGAVERDLAVLGRIDDQGGAAGLDAAHAPPDRPRGAADTDRLGKRIVAAGVENHELEAFGRLHRGQDLIERHGLELDVAVAGEASVGRNEIVDPTDLDAVARIVDERPIGGFGSGGKIAQLVVHLLAAEIGVELDGLEAGPAQRRRHRVGIARRVRQIRDVTILRIAD